MFPSWLSLSDDLSWWVQASVAFAFALTVALLVRETWGRGRSGFALLFTGVLGAALLCLAVLRPTRVEETGQLAKARVVILMDRSHRLTLPADEEDETRRDVLQAAFQTLRERWPDARLEPLVFGEGEPQPYDQFERSSIHSDLSEAAPFVVREGGERPKAIVLLSDGRLTEPGEPGQDEAWARNVTEPLEGTPLHTVRLVERIPRDRSIRQVDLTGTAIAHEPFRLHVEVGCEPSSLCEAPRIEVRELLEGEPPLPLAEGTARGSGGEYSLDLEVTLDRAGSRVLEVALEGDGRPDEIPANDRRLFPVQVRRDRVRMLHVAGRPTYDVRALRMFLKADESIDLISFFILRTPEDNVVASESELSLIPFPVDELFTEHLPSFDAVILQDIDARTYKLDRHFESIHDYVKKGGGLILVGGPGGFSAGGYADTPIEGVLPVELVQRDKNVTLEPLVPRYTTAGRAAPMLTELRELLGDRLPEMSGANLVGAPRSGAMVLWEHPELSAVGTNASALMPLLALGEVGDGRSIALAVDGTHLLRFGRLGASVSGQAHAALWEGLLGWLMRDPRYEASQVSLESPCLAGQPVSLVVKPLPGQEGAISLELERLRSSSEIPEPLEVDESFEPISREAGRVAFELNALRPGGYAARVWVGEAPPTRHVFACEQGGPAYADSRPDPDRLERLSERAGGVSVAVDGIGDLPEPESTYVAAQRSSEPLLPAWAWSLAAAFLLSLHWVLRRLVGFS